MNMQQALLEEQECTYTNGKRRIKSPDRRIERWLD